MGERGVGEQGMSGWLSRLFPSRPKASPEEARQLQNQGAILLDVREDTEWRAGHAPGARHIPLSRLPARMKDLPAHRTVITVCRSGHRSAGAAAMLARNGREVVNLRGGMHAWARAGLPVVASGGRPGRVL
ncbi:MAG: rhodanese-like domain-containing protein [Streptosporangiaceae bacterium]